MDIQRHERIKQIKKLSVYLSKALRFAEFMIWMAIPLAYVIFLASNSFTLKLGRIVVLPADLTAPQRLAVAALTTITLLLTLLAVRYSRQLMEQFSQGRVFDVEAMRMARKAVNCALALFALEILIEIGAMVYTGTLQIPGPALTVFYGFLVFGLLHIMLWSLEVGCDLSDESELTI